MSDGPYELPEGWRWVRLGEVATQIRSGFAHRKRDVTGGDLLHLRPYNIGTDGTLDLTQKFFIPMDSIREEDVLLEPSDVLFNNTNSVELVGKTALVTQPMKAAFSNHITLIRTRREICAGEWLALVMRVLWQRGFFAQKCNKWIGQAGYNTKMLEETLIPLPPLDEQQRIVAKVEALMARVREARRLRTEAQKDAERLMQAALAEVFPRPGSALPHGWRWVRLGEVCLPTERRDPTKNPSTCFVYVDISAIDNTIGKITLPKVILGQDAPSRARKVIRTGDVIFATTRPYLKNIALVSFDLDGQICSTGFCVIRANREFAEPEFLFHLCRSDFVTDQLTAGKMRGASYPAVTDNDVYNTLIPLPPLDEQRRIVAYLAQVQKQVTMLKRVQAKTEAEFQRLKQAILDKAFRGEL
ncbi:Type-1 restriction enzyme EcoKI specificity protein [Moorella humiferrea]|uniref:Type-1 restriction enzyme EcoKI specificity protein n=1 Tax=Neomoorella humiferrea TaxID=676965 RepID=A0A2T0AV89_9FIRM|nr:restriction endonuclease subunit S [Moorella humiferrea]PRR74519.1 Type-1 restriction enzyme EcoKI specificity protein [Moorella humiferrea]